MQEFCFLRSARHLMLNDTYMKFREESVSAFKFGWLVGCFGFNDPLRQYFSLYRVVSKREGERGEKG